MGDIKVDQKAKISFKMDEDSEKEFECRVKEVQKDRLSLEFPKEILEFADYLEEGSELPIKIFTPTGVNMFDTIVINSPLEDDFVIEYVENSTKIQRREYSRVPIDAKVIISRADKVNIVTRTIDISGGGIRFFSKDRFVPGEQAGIFLYLPYEPSSIRGEGVIIYKEYPVENEYVLLFTNIDEKERERIIKKCFKMQLDEQKQ